MDNIGKLYDFIIIGAGVIGCSVARELARYKADVLVIEKEDDVASEISKANSGVLHTGFNTPTGTLKSKANVAGRAYFEKMASELNFSMRVVGKLVVAMNEEERKHLVDIYERGLKNEVLGLSLIEEDELKHMEPNIHGKYALFSARAGIIDPYGFVISLAENACLNGVKFTFEEEVVRIDKHDGGFLVGTTGNNIYAGRWVINCAGLHSDDVSRLVAETEYKIYPVKGEYYITDKMEGLISSMIYPVPPAHGAGLGIHFTPTIEHNILLGPSAQFIDDKNDTACTREIMRTIKAEIDKYIPKLAEADFIRNYAGIRPKLVTGKEGDPKFADFIIEENKKAEKFIDLIGIESPGLTAAPAIAKMVIDIIGNKEDLVENKEFNPYREKPLKFASLSPEEQSQLIAENSDYGIMVCRCETVTQAEIIKAIENPLGVYSQDAIKRRTRAMMGRCQGGFCSPRMVDTLMDKYGKKATEIYKNNKKSSLFYGLIKGEAVE